MDLAVRKPLIATCGSDKYIRIWYLFINIGIMKIKRWNVVRFLQKKLTVLQFIHQDYFWLLVFKIN